MRTALCKNCRKEIYQESEEDWKHSGSNNIICSYNYAVPITKTIKETIRETEAQS